MNNTTDLQATDLQATDLQVTDLFEELDDTELVNINGGAAVNVEANLPGLNADVQAI